MIIKVFKRYFYIILLILIVMGIYYKLFFFGKIPFPADLMVVSYSPWFDYYKFPVQNPLISDIFSQFILWKYLSIDLIKNLQWPLWNPYSFTGTPLLATYHSATLYPLNILLFLPNHLGWGLFIFSSTLISALTMYLLLSTWIKSKPASILGSLVYSFSGLMTTWAEFGTAVHGMAWLPLAIYSIEKYFQIKKIRFILLSTLSTALIILAGNAQITTYSLFTITIFSIFRLKSNNFKSFFLHIFPVFLSIIVAFGITAMQLLSSYELLGQSIRAGDSYTRDQNFGLLPLREVFKFFSADFYGNPVTRNYFGFLNYSETSSFLGTLTLPLLIFSIIFLRKSLLTYFFLGVFVFALTLSFDNLLSHSFYSLSLPLLTSSFASRMLFMVTFSASILCAFSLDQILTKPNQEGKFIKSLLWSLAAIFGILIGTYLTSIIVKNIILNTPGDAIKAIYEQSPDYSLSGFRVAIRNTTVPFFILLSAIISYFILRKFAQKNLIIFTVILILLITLDLGRYFLKFNPFTPSEYIFPKTPSIEYLQAQPGLFRVGREHAEVLPPNTWAAYKLQSIEGYDPIYLYNYSSFMHYLNGGKIVGGSSSRYAELSAAYNSPYLDASNVKYFIAILRDKNGLIGGDEINFKFKEAKYPIAFKDRSSVILENPESLDRVYFAKSSQLLSEEETRVLMDQRLLNPKQTVVINKDLGVSGVTGKGEVKILSYTPNIVTIQTKTDREELLVLADQYEKGWNAKIDNTPTLISPANLIFRAVKIPAGVHIVSFYYWPDSFSLGLKISALTGILAVTGLLFAIIRKVF